MDHPHVIPLAVWRCDRLCVTRTIEQVGHQPGFLTFFEKEPPVAATSVERLLSEWTFVRMAVMSPGAKRMFDLGREVLSIAARLPIDEFDGWYHFFSSAWGYLHQAKKLGYLERLLDQFGDEELWEAHMRNRRSRK